MVNFDVQGSLMPNLYTMIVQLCATLIIFLCIKKWLWKPVKNILAKRADAMQASLDSAFEQNEEARVNLEASRKELNDAKESSREIINAARQEAVNLKNEIVSDAKRLGKPIVRFHAGQTSNYPAAFKFNLAANDGWLNMRFPTREKNNNAGIIDNQEGSQPTPNQNGELRDGVTD